ncbi:putative manganese transporter [Motilimonas sp. E26]|uniref:putative manganese transporter n=1 Tax=Motilimonas sp. E26 TaxID=2865674 RepID=UPI001E59A781|nr:putative manganese transporter [Motilimonas sp. E26]MCE0556978.1 putative manganese transporter [Motilimonas sp. E26]
MQFFATDNVTYFSLKQFTLSHKRLFLPVLLLTLLLQDDLQSIIVATLADAFWAVSCYVAFTLTLYHYLSRLFDHTSRISQLYRHSRQNQVIFAALMGALPGCGGAIIVTTQFIQGKVGFSAMVAVLTATMGDAAFLLLASKPQVGLFMIVLGVAVGMISGIIINFFHSDDYLRPSIHSTPLGPTIQNRELASNNSIINIQGLFWQLLMVPALIIAALNSFQININQLLSLPSNSIEWVGAILSLLTLSLWALTKKTCDYQSTVAESDKQTCIHPMEKVAQDTHFVSAWVIVALLSFELTIHFAGVNLSESLTGWGPWMPLMGLIIGLLPGCGPQILVTSLYISSAVPLSSQIANGISNDGDALFPALALAPKAALVATFYSAIPAFVVAYGYYYLFE